MSSIGRYLSDTREHHIRFYLLCPMTGWQVFAFHSISWKKDYLDEVDERVWRVKVHDIGTSMASARFEAEQKNKRLESILRMHDNSCKDGIDDGVE